MVGFRSKDALARYTWCWFGQPRLLYTRLYTVTRLIKSDDSAGFEWEGDRSMGSYGVCVCVWDLLRSGRLGFRDGFRGTCGVLLMVLVTR